MLRNYREIVYGVIFGLGAAILDLVMDARAENQTFSGEIGAHPAMLLYRVVFVLFGFLLGWLLWRNHQHERRMGELVDKVQRFLHDYEAQAVVLHTNLQMLLTKNLQFPPEAEALMRATYEKSRDLQALARQRPNW
jgi:H+/Cl- antiporter ClcA